VPSMILFGPGVVLFTVHYLMLRGFYALERTRTVFYIQCVIAATNIAVAVVLVHGATPEQTSPALVVAYSASYLVGSTISYAMLTSRLGGLRGNELLRFVVRLLLAALVSTGLAWALGEVLPGTGHTASHLVAGLRVVVIGVVDVAIFLALARAMRLREVTDVIDVIVRRLRGAGAS
jgi:putative peptidoglycan lipid II flippase